MKHLPNVITLLNGFFGCVGIAMAMENNYPLAFIMMLIAAAADFLDGLLARLLKAKSGLGGQLDSLSDLITFGVLPGIILFQMLQGVNLPMPWLSYTAFLVPVFSALRLGRFNISEDQDVNFKGVPTPINGLTLASLAMIESSYLQNGWVLIGISVLSSVLMNINLPLIGMKFSGFDFQENLARYLLILVAIILVFTLHIASIPVILLAYILISILHLKLKVL